VDLERYGVKDELAMVGVRGRDLQRIGGNIVGAVMLAWQSSAGEGDATKGPGT
jgi:hypothetical protein